MRRLRRAAARSRRHWTSLVAEALAAMSLTASARATAAPYDAVCAAHRALQTSADCAAWVSAQAALDALFWGRIQGVAAAVGLVGLLLTLIFALQANRTARRSNEQQLRGWSKLTPRVAGNLIRSTEGCSLAVDVEVENIGSTPTIDAQLFVRLYSKGDIGLEMQRFADSIIASRGAEYPCTLFPGERVLRSLRLDSDAYGVSERSESIMLSLLVGARYRTIFDRPGGRPRLTLRVYDLSNSEGGLLQVNRPAGPGSLVLSTNILVPGVVT